MGFGYGLWFKLFKQFPDDLFGNRTGAVFVLRKKQRKRRFKIDDFDSRGVVSKEIDPSLAHLPSDVGGVECEVLAGSKVNPALFTSGLDDFALIVGCIDI